MSDQAEASDVVGRNNAESHARVVVKVVASIKRAANSDVAEGVGVDDAFLERTPERSAVGVLGTEVRVPSVEVGVEVEEGDRTVATGNLAK